MTALLPTTRKICWYTLHSLLFSNSNGSKGSENENDLCPRAADQLKDGENPVEPSYYGFYGLRKRFNSFLLLSNTNNNNNDTTTTTTIDETGTNSESSATTMGGGSGTTTTTTGSSGIFGFLNRGKFCSNLVNNTPTHVAKNSCNNKTTIDGLTTQREKVEEELVDKIEHNESDFSCSCGSTSSSNINSKKYNCLDYSEAPAYLKFNPYITGGYRNNLTPSECLKSIFMWTNETLNIWTHLSGWFFFLGLTIYDYMGLLNLPNIQPWDQKVITLLLITFQVCMLLSALYHVFCCSSEKFYRNWLSADLFGVSLVLLGIYLSGIYYAFSCIPFWLNFYLVSVGLIFASVMLMQVFPFMQKEHNFRWRLLIFGGWGVYGVVPTMHWAILHGVSSSEAVSLLLPRIFYMYMISGAAFFFYLTRIPERLSPGLVNYIGSSHQIWHILIFAALYHWHNTGILYLQFRAEHPCQAEYAELFPESYDYTDTQAEA